MPTLSNDIVARYDNSKSRRENWRSFLQNAYKYIFPNRNSFDSYGRNKTEGENKNPDVYDITAPLAARALVSKLLVSITPPFQRWAEFTPGTIFEKGQDIKALEEALQEETEKFFVYINDSNFALAVTECYMDLIMGTAALLIEEGDDADPLIFTAVPIDTLSIEEDSKGLIQSWYRDQFRLKLDDIKAKWPDATIPRELASNNDPTAEFQIMDCMIYDEVKKKYTYYVTHMKSKQILYEEEESDSQRLLVFRWSKMPGEVFGRGIAHESYPTIRTLNRIIELMIDASEIGAFPPMIGFQDAVFNPANLKLSPKTIITVKGMPGMQDPIRPLNFGANLQLAQLEIRELQQKIEKAFFSEPLGSVEAPKKTATEVSIRQQQFLEEVGGVFGRLEVEFLSRIIERCVYILKKKGSNFISNNIDLNNKKVKLKFRSPLAKLQDQNDLQSLATGFQIVSGILGEFALASMNLADIPEYVAEKSGSKLELFKSKAEIATLAADINKKILAGLGDQQQQQPQQELPTPQPLGAPQQ